MAKVSKPVCSTSSKILSFMAMVMVVFNNHIAVVMSSDADPFQDFCVSNLKAAGGGMGMFPCKPNNEVKAADFGSNILAMVGNTSASPSGVALSLAWAGNLGGLNTQGLSVARIDYAPGGVVPPHVHPRASEIIILISGTLTVGFVDTTNTLYSNVLKSPGSIFVFPRGLVHFIYNHGSQPALSFSTLNSQNPGASLLSTALFASHPPLPDIVLEKSFQLKFGQVHHLKKAFGN